MFFYVTLTLVLLPENLDSDQVMNIVGVCTDVCLCVNIVVYEELWRDPSLQLELNMHFPFRLSIMPVLERCILIALPPPSRSLTQ